MRRGQRDIKASASRRRGQARGGAATGWGSHGELPLQSIAVLCSRGGRPGKLWPARVAPACHAVLSLNPQAEGARQDTERGRRFADDLAFGLDVHGLLGLDVDLPGAIGRRLGMVHMSALVHSGHVGQEL